MYEVSRAMELAYLNLSLRGNDTQSEYVSEQIGCLLYNRRIESIEINFSLNKWRGVK